MKNFNNNTDKELIVAYNKGNQNALTVLAKKWHKTFCNLAFWIVKDADTAKDIAQESWTIIIGKLETLQEPEKFKSWAISIVNRKAIDWLRANKREQNKLIKHFNESEKTTSFSETDDSAIQKALLKSIDKLSVEHQMVIRLFYKESDNLKEISEILQISLGTTNSRLFLAREKL
jgi:RNA polymerase sigma-70 factor (ECF subfamily)